MFRDGDHIKVRRPGGKRLVEYVVTGDEYQVSRWTLVPCAPYRYGPRGSETIGKSTVVIVGQDEIEMVPA